MNQTELVKGRYWKEFGKFYRIQNRAFNTNTKKLFQEAWLVGIPATMANFALLNSCNQTNGASPMSVYSSTKAGFKNKKAAEKISTAFV